MNKVLIALVFISTTLGYVHAQNPALFKTFLVKQNILKEETLEAPDASTASAARVSMPYTGPANGTPSVVVFLDYNCGYCISLSSEIDQILQEDKNVKIIFNETPILGPTSTTAAAWALAAQKQGQYYAFHKAVMNSRGSRNEASLTKIAKSLGLDAAQLKRDSQSSDVQTLLKQSKENARRAGVEGVPVIAINNAVIRGNTGAYLRNAIKQARNP